MDTSKSSFMGKAYEYACVIATFKLISVIRPVVIVENDSYRIAKQRYEEEISEKDQITMMLSAQAGISEILKMEPRIFEEEKDVLNICLQADTAATEYGDIRDVLFIRKSIDWEIGISVKHNHNALKHSRLSMSIDFGQKWMGIPCSQTYFSDIKPFFDNLVENKNRQVKWSEIQDKETAVYVPILKAFMREFTRLQLSNNVVAKLVEYLIGSNGKDYYKLVHHNNNITTVTPFNIHGTLNLASKKSLPEIIIPKMDLPTRIIELDFKEDSKTTLILTMNKGWSVSLRIHNASTYVEPSLKFDIKLESKPESLFYIDCEW